MNCDEVQQSVAV